DGGRSAAPLPLPVIVKPNSEGSTIGMSIVKKPEDWKPALEEASKHDAVILIEQFITGTEVTVAVLDGKALPVLEIVPKGGFYDYSSKYTKGMTEYIVPARIEEKVSARLKKLSEKIFSQLKLSGVARMDYIIDASGQEWFLEVNTIPGMTETSLVPKAAAATGITFETLCEQILKGASLKI
ncbi:MAG: ATP-grasp domain-containing protein, partial [Deltaproteobacteria bacterium]|nr:ATP-grasp domain-containing protein [Deltaproteobacteria bacterium]